MVFPNTEKTEICHGNVSKVLFVARTTMARYLTEAGFVFLLHKRVLNVSLVDWCAPMRLNVRISLLEKESATGSTLRSYEQSMERIDATITFIRRCH